MNLTLKALLVTFSFCATAAAEVTTDVEYLRRGEISLKLDVGVPEGEGPFPIAIILHGGGNKGDKQAYVTPLFGPLTAANFTWFSLDFRPVKEGIAAGVSDIEEAIRWVKAHASTYKGDPRRIALIGESSGGIFACVVAGRAKEGSSVDAVVAFYTPADLEYIMPQGKMGPRGREYWGVKEGDDLTALKREFSPISYAKAGMPPLLLVHGTADPKVPYGESLRLALACKEAGVSCELITVKDGDHGMGSWEEVDPSYKEKVFAWLRKTLAQR
jgi:acetyl esterase/lipase